MLGGQSVDVENDGRPLKKELLDYIYVNKTSALIEASLMAGAALAGAENLEDIETIGRYIGLAFQIQDDILDVTGSQEELGKPVGSDEKNHKTTYVTLEGMEKSGTGGRETYRGSPGTPLWPFRGQGIPEGTVPFPLYPQKIEVHSGCC